MTDPEARLFLTAKRPDLRTERYASDLDALAGYVGQHPLALALLSAVLGGLLVPSPQRLLERLNAGTDVGDSEDFLSGLSEDSLGTRYRRPLKRALQLLVDELSEKTSPSFDPLAMDLLYHAAFCRPTDIPIELLAESCRVDVEKAKVSLVHLLERSIAQFGQGVSVHTLTQSMIRGMLKEGTERSYDTCLLETLQGQLRLLDPNEELPDGELAYSYVMHSRSAIAYVDTRRGLDSSLLMVELEGASAYLRALVSVRLRNNGQALSALREIDAAIEWWGSHVPELEDAFASFLVIRAEIRVDLLDCGGARDDIQRAIGWMDSRLLSSGAWRSPQDQAFYSRLLNLRARAATAEERGFDFAKRDMDFSIELEEALDPPNPRALAVRYQDRSRLLRLMGRWEESEADIGYAIRCAESLRIHDGALLSGLYSERAQLELSMQRSSTDAERDLTRSIEATERQSPVDVGRLAHDYFDRSRARLELGNDPLEAEADVNYAIELGENDAQLRA